MLWRFFFVLCWKHDVWWLSYIVSVRCVYIVSPISDRIQLVVCVFFLFALFKNVYLYTLCDWSIFKYVSLSSAAAISIVYWYRKIFQGVRWSPGASIMNTFGVVYLMIDLTGVIDDSGFGRRIPRSHISHICAELSQCRDENEIANFLMGGSTSDIAAKGMIWKVFAMLFYNYFMDTSGLVCG